MMQTQSDHGRWQGTMRFQWTGIVETWALGAALVRPLSLVGALFVILAFAFSSWACGDSGSRSRPDASLDGSVGQDGTVTDDAHPGDASNRPDAWMPPADPYGPRIFYTDLTSGPQTGGQDGKGAFVSIYGRGFGSSQADSTVTVGGGEVAGYPIWSDTKVTVQLGPNAQTGDIVVHVSGKTDSNGVAFTVRAGGIFFVSTSGNDGDDGSFAHPWQSLAAAKRQLQPGDIVYPMDGVVQTDSDGPNTSLCISKHYGCEAQWGTADAPIAIVAYPGAHVTVGCQESGCPQNGIRIYAPYWTIAGLFIVGSAETYAAAASIEKAGSEPPSHGQRFVANDVTGGYYGITLSIVQECRVLGNHVHDTPHSAIYHGGWGDSSDVEVAWNRVHDLGDEAFGIKAYGHTENDHLTGLWIHHNVVYNTQAAAILVGGSDGHVPWVYDARIENNVVWKTQGQWSSGIRIGNSGVDETELDVTIVHNTVVDCTHAVEISACKTALVQDNLFVQSGGTYIHADLGPGDYTFDHNGYFGGDALPIEDSAPVEGDPLFQDASSHDYHLQAGSPAIDSGVDAGLNVDMDGILRPQGDGFDLGAYEFVPPQ